MPLQKKSILFPEDRWYCETNGNARLYDEIPPFENLRTS